MAHSVKFLLISLNLCQNKKKLLRFKYIPSIIYCRSKSCLVLYEMFVRKFERENAICEFRCKQKDKVNLGEMVCENME